MLCKYCGFANGDEDHRCLRCGRRVQGTVISAPPGYVGANALAFAPAANDDTAEFLPLQKSGPLRQEALFSSAPEAAPGGNVIPFEQIQRRAARPAAQTPYITPQPQIKPAAPAQPPHRARAHTAPVEQGMLDFVPASPLRTRMLKTDVEAQIFCEQPVATPTHRFVAAAIDAAFILIGFGILVVAFQMMGGSFGAGKMFWMGLGGALTLVALFYGLIWAIAGRETAGMAFTDLQLITFDGFPLDPRSRALRFLTTWLSFCSGGLGVLWAVADEENLTWHDHISKTFPTVKEATGAFVKQRR